MAASKAIAWCSPVIRGRKPNAKDPNLDYEVMSDEEWEEEPEGESLSVSITSLSASRYKRYRPPSAHLSRSSGSCT